MNPGLNQKCRRDRAGPCQGGANEHDQSKSIYEGLLDRHGNRTGLLDTGLSRNRGAAALTGFGQQRLVGLTGESQPNSMGFERPCKGNQGDRANNGDCQHPCRA